MSWLKKFFNSETISGRANVAKATYASFLLLYIVRRMSKNSPVPAASHSECEDTPPPVVEPPRHGCEIEPPPVVPVKPGCEKAGVGAPGPHDPEHAEEAEKAKSGGCWSQPTGQAAGKVTGDRKWSCDFEE